MNNIKHKIIFLVITTFFLSSCKVEPPPSSYQNDICKIFKHYPEWYWHALDAEKRWGTPVAIQIAIIKQESSFNSDARSARKKLFGFIPYWKRVSTSKGYSQATNDTWKMYQKESGEKGSKRNDFEDTCDFISWYGYYAKKRLGINQNDAYNLYLSYHEGITGYRKGSYNKKPWLKEVAMKVKREAIIYNRQLAVCKNKIPKKPWYKFW